MCTRLALLVGVLSFFGNAFAQSTPPALVSRIAGAFDGPVVAFERGVARSRFVDLNAGVLTRIQADLRNNPGVVREIGIEFFPDRTFVIQVTRVEAIGNGSVSYTGHVKGIPTVNATIIQNGDVVSANVAAFGRVYQIRFRGTGSGHEVREFDPSVLKDHDDDKLLEINAAPTSKRLSADVAMLDDGSTMDVMVVWTPATRALRGGVAAMQTLVALAVTETNTAYANSGVIQRLRLVYSGEIAFTETTDMSADLGSLTGTADGVMDQVHVIRDAVGADFVSLFGEYGSACGVGWFMGTESSGFAANAFNVVTTSCATGNYSFGHELGHNMGLRHDPFVDSTPTTTVDAAAVTYAHGYVDATNRMRTIMAYDNQCTASGFNCTRMQRFANAGLTMTSPTLVTAPSGTTTPWPGPTPPANASTSNDFLALNGTRDTTANFRQFVDQSGGGKLTFYFATRSVTENSGSIALTVARLAGSTGAAAVSWATAPNTAVAGTHYATAGGTLNWASGDTTERTVTVNILQNGLAEPDKSFTVNLSGVTGATLGSLASATVFIRDDEPDTFPVGACAIPAGFAQAPGSLAPWAAASDSTYQGNCALKSGAIASGSTGTSGIEWTGVTAAGPVTFKYRVSSYPSNGNMTFLIDGVQALTNTGASGWVSFTSSALTAGPHTLTWRYNKTLGFNCSNTNPPAPEGSACADKLWIDDVVIPVNFTLTVAKSGTGTGTVTSTTPAGGINCGADCTEPYLSGTSVTLAAAAGTLSTFKGWSGACSGTSSCVVSMTQARSVTASFARLDPANPDWNADNKPDIVWSNTANGATYLWYMNGPVLATDAYLTGIDPSWKIQGIADFNGDGKPDLVWRNTANGNTYVWYMNGTSFVSDAFLFGLPPEWVIQGVADFNGDGKPDFLMRNSITGNAFVWFFNNATDAGSQFLFTIDPSWKVEGVGDMNGDGQPDLLFRNMVTGLSFAWFTQFSAGTLSLAGSTPALFGIDPVWEIVQVADWNGDGSPDFLFRNRVTGVVFVWYVNGTALGGSDFITQIDPSWEIVPRR